jgi:hypothetical protein
VPAPASRTARHRALPAEHGGTKGGGDMNFLKIAISVFLNQIVSASAQRATQDDIYGNSPIEGTGGDGGILNYLSLIIFFGGLVWLFFKDRKFRLGATIYIAVLGGIVFVFTVFGKGMGLAACAIVIAVAWLTDPARK